MRDVLKKLALLCLMGSLIVVFVLHARAVEATRSPHCGTWNVIPSPNSGAGSVLYAVTTVSKTDAWAVGISESSPWLSLIEHWDGRQWKIVSSPSPGTVFNSLSAVTAISANNIWAVGAYEHPAANGYTFPLVEHWNGSAWHIVPSPSLGIASGLNGIAVISPNDIWVVGSSSIGSGPNTAALTEHWDGAHWSIVPSPAPGSSSYLYAVTAPSTKSVWAVGNEDTNQGSRTLTEHWNGATWRVIPNPNPYAGDVLSGVAQVPNTDQLWTVGGPFGGQSTQSLIEEWNGTKWHAVFHPNPGTLVNDLYSVVALSADNVWTVGDNESQLGASRTLIEHWDGSIWRVVPSPSPGASSGLQGMAQVPDTTQLWSVGSSIVSGHDQTLIEFYC